MGVGEVAVVVDSWVVLRGFAVVVGGCTVVVGEAGWSWVVLRWLGMGGCGGHVWSRLRGEKGNGDSLGGGGNGGRGNLGNERV